MKFAKPFLQAENSHQSEGGTHWPNENCIEKSQCRKFVAQNQNNQGGGGAFVDIEKFWGKTSQCRKKLKLSEFSV